MKPIVAGDNYWEDIFRTDGALLDANWQGKWSILNKVGGTSLISGDLTLSGDFSKLLLRIDPVDTIKLSAGSYVLVIKIFNTNLGYSKEYRTEQVKVIAASIPA